MREMSIREVTSENWREALCLTVAPEQQRFVAGNDVYLDADVVMEIEKLFWTWVVGEPGCDKIRPLHCADEHSA